jgi:Rrf2 family protein
MISQTAEYALRAVVFLAGRDHEPCTAQVIAEATKVPSGYLSKIMQSLARDGVVTSRRGLHGGFTLVLSPQALSVHDVLEAVDPIRRYRTCPLELPWHCNNMCQLHRSLDEMIARFEVKAKKTPISDLLPTAKPKALTAKQARQLRVKKSRARSR